MQTHVQFSRGQLALSFADLVRSGGILRLWRGAPGVAAACIPSHAAYFTAYEWGKEAFGANGAGHRPVAAAAAGSVATLLHDAVLTPMDVVKQRLQLGYYRGIAHCVSTMLREEGALAFFRSYPTTLAMNVPYAAVAVAANESLKRIIVSATSEEGGQGAPPGLWTYLLAGAGAGGVAAAVTCPLDVVKTRLQTASLSSSVGAGHGPSGAAPPQSAGATAAAGVRPNEATGVAGNGGPASGSSRAGSAASLPFSSSSTRTVLGRGGGTPPLQFIQHQVATLYTASSAGRAPATALSTARAILAEEGVGAFFKGAGARVLVHAPSMAISWSTYETVKALLRRYDPGGRWGSQ